jgi:hypothetical protein
MTKDHMANEYFKGKLYTNINMIAKQRFGTGNLLEDHIANEYCTTCFIAIFCSLGSNYWGW